jgi:hypothetical protein
MDRVEKIEEWKGRKGTDWRRRESRRLVDSQLHPKTRVLSPFYIHLSFTTLY